MSEKLTPTSEAEQQDTNPYEGMSREALDAIATAKASIDPESSTPVGDLRTAVREGLEATGDEGAYGRFIRMDNLEFKDFVDGASGEIKNRRVDELKSIIDAYDSHDSFGDRRTALREALEAAGDKRAFRTVYDMNNLDIASFVDGARSELQKETSLDKEDALNEAYSEYEEREGTPYDVDKGRVKDVENARVLAKVEDIVRRVKTDPEAAKKAGIYDELRKVQQQIADAMAGGGDKGDEIGIPKDVKTGTDEIGIPKDIKSSADDEIGVPKDIKSPDEIGVPKDIRDGIDEIGIPRDIKPGAGGEIGTPRDIAPAGEGSPDDDDDSEPRRRNIFRRAYNRAYLFFATHNTPASLVAHGWERYRDSRRAHVATVIGGIAIIGLGIASRHYGWFDHHGGGGSTGTGTADAAKGGVEGGKAPGAFSGAPASPAEVFPANAHNISSGEGWFEAMSRAGIKDPTVQREILQNNSVMEQLHSMGLAYKAPELGGWGLNMTENGQMPDAALQILSDAAKAAR